MVQTGDEYLPGINGDVETTRPGLEFLAKVSCTLQWVGDEVANTMANLSCQWSRSDGTMKDFNKGPLTWISSTRNVEGHAAAIDMHANVACMPPIGNLSCKISDLIQAAASAVMTNSGSSDKSSTGNPSPL